MKLASFLLVALVVFTQTASADLVFTLSPANASIPLGSQGIFEVYISNSVAGNLNVAGIDLTVQAGDGTTNGIFTAASATSALLGVTPFIVNDGIADASNNLVGGVTITTVPQLYGTLNLDTTGATPGNNYQMAITSAFVVNSGSVSVPFQTSPINFNITAVPEPSSILTAAALGLGGMFYRRRRALRS